jgi:Predicted membrane protein (DUF2142)
MPSRDAPARLRQPAADEAAPAPARRRHLGFLPVWAASTAVFFLLSLVYSLATPVPSGPDEPAQMVKAASVAHGQLLGKHPADFPPTTVLATVPGTVAHLYDPSSGCNYADPRQPTGCAPAVLVAPGPQVTSTYVGRYPPLYYAVVGLPSLFPSHPLSLRAMRAMSCLLDAAFLGLAFAVVARWSRSRWIACGVGLAVTPMALYLGSVVNPSGLEVAAVVAAWVSAVVLVTQWSRNPPTGLVVAFTVAALTATWTRPLSAAWIVILLATTAALWPREARHLLRHRSARLAGGVLAAGIVAAGVYVALAHALAQEVFLLPPGTTTRQAVGYIWRDLGIWAQQLVAAYGSPNVPSPHTAVVLWGAGVGVLAVVALITARRWQAALFVLFVVGALMVIPFVASYAKWRTNGLIWQGRYELPLAAGIPILAAALLTRRRSCPTWVLTAVALVATLGQAAAFYQLLRRYTVGLAVQNPFRDVANGWHPPLGAVTTAVLGAALILCLGAGLTAIGRRSGSAPLTAPPEAERPEPATP